MYVCMCIYVCTYVHVSMYYTLKYIYTVTYIDMYCIMYTQVHKHTCTCMFMYLCVHYKVDV